MKPELISNRLSRSRVEASAQATSRLSSRDRNGNDAGSIHIQPKKSARLTTMLRCAEVELSIVKQREFELTANLGGVRHIQKELNSAVPMGPTRDALPSTPYRI